MANTTLIKATTAAYVGEYSTSGTNRGILPYLLVDTTPGGEGADGFATLDPVNGIRGLLATEYSTALTASDNVRLSASGNVTADLTINSLHIDTTAVGITIDPGKTLNLESGGILATASGSVITGGSISSANELDIWTLSGASLTISSQIAGNVNLTKSGAGALTLQQALPTLGFGVIPATFTVNNGSVVLASTGANPLPYGTGLSLMSGATLDLGGNSQVFGNLTSNNLLPGKAGTITNGTVILNSSVGASFGGSITDGAASSSVQKIGGGAPVASECQHLFRRHDGQRRHATACRRRPSDGHVRRRRQLRHATVGQQRPGQSFRSSGRFDADLAQRLHAHLAVRARCELHRDGRNRILGPRGQRDQYGRHAGGRRSHAQRSHAAHRRRLGQLHQRRHAGQ